MLAAITHDSEKPGIEEIYERATNTSNLKQEPEVRTSADVLRDMAMSADRIGASLLRLRAQWESCTKPERQVPRTVKQFLALLGDKEKAIAAHNDERFRCDASYENALATLAAKLPDLDSVRAQLTPIAVKWRMGISSDPVTRSDRTQRRELEDAMLERLKADVDAAGGDAERTAAQASLNHRLIEVRRSRSEDDNEDRRRAQDKISAVIRYWLHQACPKCDGLKFLVLSGTSRLSNKMCPPASQGGCGGTGFATVPHGQEGRKLANHMDQCVHRYKQRMGARRKAFASIPTIDKLSKRMVPKGAGTSIDPDSD